MNKELETIIEYPERANKLARERFSRETTERAIMLLTVCLGHKPENFEVVSSGSVFWNDICFSRNPFRDHSVMYLKDYSGGNSTVYEVAYPEDLPPVIKKIIDKREKREYRKKHPGFFRRLLKAIT